MKVFAVDSTCWGLLAHVWFGNGPGRVSVYSRRAAGATETCLILLDEFGASLSGPMLRSIGAVQCILGMSSVRVCPSVVARPSCHGMRPARPGLTGN